MSTKVLPSAGKKRTSVARPSADGGSGRYRATAATASAARSCAQSISIAPATSPATTLSSASSRSSKATDCGLSMTSTPSS